MFVFNERKIMKMFERLQCVLVVFLFVAVAGYVTYCYAQFPTPNQKCVTILEPLTCQSIPSSYCQAAGIFGVGGSCQGCNSSNTIPKKTCVFYEGQTCNGGSTGAPCGSSDHFTGYCVQVGMGPTFGCANMVPDGLKCGGESSSAWICN